MEIKIKSVLIRNKDNVVIKHDNQFYRIYQKKEFVCQGMLVDDFCCIASNSDILAIQNKDKEYLRSWIFNKVDYKLRGKIWKILCNYYPLSSKDTEYTDIKKRGEYIKICDSFYTNSIIESTENPFYNTFVLIKKDILRTQSNSNLFRNKFIQTSLERILLIFSIRLFLLDILQITIRKE